MHIIGPFHHLVSLLLIKNFFEINLGKGKGKKHYGYFGPSFLFCA